MNDLKKAEELEFIVEDGIAIHHNMDNNGMHVVELVDSLGTVLNVVPEYDGDLFKCGNKSAEYGTASFKDDFRNLFNGYSVIKFVYDDNGALIEIVLDNDVDNNNNRTRPEFYCERPKKVDCIYNI